jgi:hypothetical protein
MKRTLIALMALAGVAMANGNEAKLLYGMDFNKVAIVGGVGGVVYENVADNPGSGLVSTVGGGYRNYVTGMDGSKASDVRGAGYYFQINSAENSTTGLGVNTTDGFTLTFNTNFVSGDDWTSFLEINIGGQDLSFQWGALADITTVNVFTKGAGGAVGTGAAGSEGAKLAVGQIKKETWYNIALVAAEGALTLSAFDSTGALVSTDTVTALYTGNLNSVSGYTNYKFAKSYIDNLAIYDRALSTKELVAVTQYEMEKQTVMQMVPEPATATLSLLALAGLAARRRRK